MASELKLHSFFPQGHWSSRAEAEFAKRKNSLKCINNQLKPYYIFVLKTYFFWRRLLTGPLATFSGKQLKIAAAGQEARSRWRQPRLIGARYLDKG